MLRKRLRDLLTGRWDKTATGQKHKPTTAAKSEDDHIKKVKRVKIDEVAPPGKEHIVKALKKKFSGDKTKAFRIAWAMHNKNVVESLNTTTDEAVENKSPNWKEGRSTTHELSKIGLKHIKSYHPKGTFRRNPDHTEVSASDELNQAKKPTTYPGHKSATGIAFGINHEDKHVHFREITSRKKGHGTKMVDAVVKSHPDHTFSTTDLSRREGDKGPSFWDKMKARHKDKFG